MSSRRMLLAALFTVILVVAVNLAWWIFYDRAESMLDHQLSRRLSAIAQTTAAGITEETVELLVMDDFSAYTTVIDILERSRQADSLSEIFVLDGSHRYLATTSINGDSLYFLSLLNGPWIDSIFFGTDPRPLVTPSYQTGSVLLKTAFVPLQGVDGTVMAVLGVEANVDYFDSMTDLKQNLYFSTALSLAGGLLFGFLFILVQRRIGKLQQNLMMNETHAYLGRMVAVVAHEVRNPLMIIRASAERLKKKTDMEEALFIVEEVDRLNSLVTGYLDFARGDRSEMLDGTIQQINTEQLISNIKKQIQDKLGDIPIKWYDSPSPENLTFDGYPGALKQVLLNLLINASDACRGAELPLELSINVASRSNNIVLIVADHGPGMSRSELKHIGDPFFTTKQHGSGLGLYVSQKIVARMGGSLDITSRLDKGTIVTITLPKKAAQ